MRDHAAQPHPFNILTKLSYHFIDIQFSVRFLKVNTKKNYDIFRIAHFHTIKWFIMVFKLEVYLMKNNVSNIIQLKFTILRYSILYFFSKLF